MTNDNIITIRKLSQQYAYSSLQMHESIAKSLGFSATDHKYLSFFLVKGSLTAGELAELSGLSTGAVTGLIDRFEKKKLVKRDYDSNDRRKVIIVPDSKKITKLFEPYYKEFQADTEKLIASFSHQDLEIIKSYLSKAIKLAIDTNQKLAIKTK